MRIWTDFNPHTIMAISQSRLSAILVRLRRISANAKCDPCDTRTRNALRLLSGDIVALEKLARPTVRDKAPDARTPSDQTPHTQAL